MRVMLSRLGFVAFGFVCGALAMAWTGGHNQEVLLAQARKPLALIRTFTGDDGKTHVEQTEIKMTPTADGGAQSDRVKVAGMRFVRRVPSRELGFHPPQHRQYIVTLSGRGEIELEDGKKFPVDEDHILFAEDMTGKGHIMRGVGKDDRVSMIVELPEDK